MEHFIKFENSKVPHKTSVSHMLFNYIYTIIESPFKSLMATITGFVTSFIPTVVTEAAGRSLTTVESLLQIAVLAVTLMIGVTSLITWWQKQIDRRKKLKTKDDDK